MQFFYFAKSIFFGREIGKFSVRIWFFLSFWRRILTSFVDHIFGFENLDGFGYSIGPVGSFFKILTGGGQFTFAAFEFILCKNKFPL